jgi:hypothetical protein
MINKKKLNEIHCTILELKKYNKHYILFPLIIDNEWKASLKNLNMFMLKFKI